MKNLTMILDNASKSCPSTRYIPVIACVYITLVQLPQPTQRDETIAANDPIRRRMMWIFSMPPDIHPTVQQRENGTFNARRILFASLFSALLFYALLLNIFRSRCRPRRRLHRWRWFRSLSLWAVTQNVLPGLWLMVYFYPENRLSMHWADPKKT